MKEKSLRSKIRNFIFESIKSESIKQHDVVLVKNTSNGFNGLGVVESIENNQVKISTLRAWIEFLKNPKMEYLRKNTISSPIEQVEKFNKGITQISIEDEKLYEIYIHLLKKYLNDEL